MTSLYSQNIVGIELGRLEVGYGKDIAIAALIYMELISRALGGLIEEAL